MNRVKRIIVLVLSFSIMMMSMLSVMAATTELDELNRMGSSTRMFSRSIVLAMDFIDDAVVMDCVVTGPAATESITLLFVLKEENAAGNLVMVDTWSDSGDGYRFDNEYEYSPAIEGREYELTVRVGIYDENGLVGYDYETVSATN